MSAPLKDDAAFRYTESGQGYWHYLGTKLRKPVADTRQRVDRFESADLTTIRAIAIGDGVQELRADLRYDGMTESLRRFLAAARRGASLEYFPSVANPSESYACVLVGDDGVSLDADFWWNRRNSVSVVLRRIDGGSWQGVTEGSLFYYRAGNSLPGLTFTRSGSVGSYIDELGVLQSGVAANIFRTTWAGGVPYLLLEAARTNLATAPEDFSAGAWTPTSMTVTANDRTAPDGTTTADHLEASAASVSRVTDAVTITANDTVSLSCFVEPDSADWCFLTLFGPGGTNGARAWFDISTGAIGSTSAFGSGYAVSDLTIEQVSPGVYRIGAVWTTTTDTAITVGLALADGDSDTASASGLDLWAWGFQAEVGESVSSYMGAGTRNADTFYTGFEHSPQAMTIYVKGKESGTLAMSLGLLHIGSATAASDPRLVIDATGGFYRASHDNGTAVVSSTLAAAPSPSEGFELRVVLNADGSVQIGQSVAEAAETTASASSANALGTAWADTRLYLNSQGAANRGVAALTAVKILPGVKTLAEMRAA